MRPRQHIPTRWLMTDERLGDSLWDALAALPQGGGVVFRHYGVPPAERRALFRRVAIIARRRRLVLVRAGPERLGREDGLHNGPGRGLVTAAAHDRREAVAAARRGASVLFVSPIFPTRSHPGARTVGARRLRAITAGLPVRVIALGGMDEAKFRRLRPLGVHGWAGIDAWARAGRQKRKAVPT